MIEVYKGDITTFDADIIVNAANKTLLGGGGVDGAIHRAAGKELLSECKTLGGCEVGEAKMTFGYNLKAKRVIHIVWPDYKDGNHNERQLLSKKNKNSLRLAEKYRVENNLDSVSIAFPCISTGVYRYPFNEACSIAYKTVKENINPHIKVIFVCFSDSDYKTYLNKIKEND